MSSLLVLVQYLNSGVFSVEAKLYCILTAFPDNGAEKKLVLSPHRKLCRGSRLWRRKHPLMEIYSSQEDVRLTLNHGVGVRMHDALDVHGASDLGVGVRMHDALEVHGASDLGVGVRPFCKLQNVPYLE